MKKNKDTQSTAEKLKAAAKKLMHIRPNDEMIQGVYGPPEWFEGKKDPAKANIQRVYGPPVTDADKTDDEEDDKNIQEVYGPPKWFE